MKSLYSNSFNFMKLFLPIVLFCGCVGIFSIELGLISFPDHPYWFVLVYLLAQPIVYGLGVILIVDSLYELKPNVDRAPIWLRVLQLISVLLTCVYLFYLLRHTFAYHAFGITVNLMKVMELTKDYPIVFSVTALGLRTIRCYKP